MRIVDVLHDASYWSCTVSSVCGCGKDRGRDSGYVDIRTGWNNNGVYLLPAGRSSTCIYAWMTGQDTFFSEVCVILRVDSSCPRNLGGTLLEKFTWFQKVEAFSIVFIIQTLGQTEKSTKLCFRQNRHPRQVQYKRFLRKNDKSLISEPRMESVSNNSVENTVIL